MIDDDGEPEPEAIPFDDDAATSYSRCLAGLQQEIRDATARATGRLASIRAPRVARPSGVGEQAAAMTSAVYHATGWRDRTLPIAPDGLR